MPGDEVILEIVGEGATDRGRVLPGQPEVTAEAPTRGVVPILVHKLCGEPATMRVKRRGLAFLPGKGLRQKVAFARWQAPYNGSAGLVVVLDTEGDHPGQVDTIKQARDSCGDGFPMAVGVAHPCIEAWLLADPAAIDKGLGLPPGTAAPHPGPESLPAPQRDRRNNPKMELGRCVGRPGSLSTTETAKIAAEIRVLDRLRERCPLGFAPFADEVEGRIRPLFHPPAGDG